MCNGLADHNHTFLHSNRRSTLVSKPLTICETNEPVRFLRLEMFAQRVKKTHTRSHHKQQHQGGKNVRTRPSKIMLHSAFGTMYTDMGTCSHKWFFSFTFQKIKNNYPSSSRHFSQRSFSFFLHLSSFFPFRSFISLSRWDYSDMWGWCISGDGGNRDRTLCESHSSHDTTFLIIDLYSFLQVCFVCAFGRDPLLFPLSLLAEILSMPTWAAQVIWMILHRIRSQMNVCCSDNIYRHIIHSHHERWVLCKVPESIFNRDRSGWRDTTIYSCSCFCLNFTLLHMIPWVVNCINSENVE